MKLPKKIDDLNYPLIFLISLSSTLVLWFFPMLFGKYADTSYPYIPADAITKELVSIKNVEENVHVVIDKRPWCPEKSPHLQGLQLEIKTDLPDNWTEEFERKFAQELGISAGGAWEPPDCKARYDTTIIVGVRNRTEHLHRFLFHMHPFLRRQQLRYRIVVVEQLNNAPYNRGKLFNVGYKEWKRILTKNTIARTTKIVIENGKSVNADTANDETVNAGEPRDDEACVVLHDVDLLPLHDHNIYACTAQPRHMTPAIDAFRYQLPYRTLCGGAVALTATLLQKVNGFSNSFSGWGGEDDDFYDRIIAQGAQVVRFDPRVALYIMLPHEPSEPADDRFTTLQNKAGLSHTDGLSTLVYNALNSTAEHLMHHIQVDW